MNINNTYPFTYEPLPYEYDALEPYIDTETMHYHHDKHYKAYVDKLNAAVEANPQYKNWTLLRLLLNVDSLPSDFRTAVINNGGGVFNHELYFNSMGPDKTNPSTRMMNFIMESFGNYENFMKAIKAAALGQFGSGYGWLVQDGITKRLMVIATPNQDTVISLSMMPLLPLDVWEHAYYLKHKNERDKYIDDWFNVINWDWVEGQMED